MKKGPSIFFRAVVALVGAAALAFMLLEPLAEGRNAHATLFETYFKDPFLAYAYASSVPFFMALYRTFGLLGRSARKDASPLDAARTMRTIKRCAIALVFLAAAPVACLFAVRPGDDIAGGVAMGLAATVVFISAAAVSAIFEKRFRNAGEPPKK